MGTGIQEPHSHHVGPSGEKVKVVPIFLAFLISGFIGLFSETALNVAFTELMRVFSISSSTIQWLTTGYLLTLGILVPVSGFLIQMYTTRQLFFTSVVFSAAGCLIASLAPHFEVLLVARVIQAVGTGLLLPLMFNTILLIFPAEKRGAAMGIIGLVVMCAPAVGPTISGLLIQTLGWHWIFGFSFLFLVVALLCGIFFMQNVSTVRKLKIDSLSVVLSTLGFGGIVFGCSSAGEGSGGWGSPTVIVSLVVGIAGLLLFVWRQLSLSKPMMNLRAFRYPMFTVGLLLVFICMTVILSSMLVLPMYLQGGLLLSTFTAGLVMLPGGVVNGIMSPISGRLFDKYGPKWMVLPGLCIMAVALWFYSNVTTVSSLALIIALHCVLMIGISMVMMSAQTNGLNQLPRELYPDGTAIMNTMQQVAGAIGTAVSVSMLTRGQAQYLSQAASQNEPSVMAAALAAGAQQGFTFGLIAAVVGIVAAFFFKRVNIQKQPDRSARDEGDSRVLAKS